MEISSASTTHGILVTPCDPWPYPYQIEGGLRRVKPYHYTYNTHCKERWRGRSVFDVFSSEFRDRSEEYYKEAILSGAITVNGKRIGCLDDVIRNGDIVSHTQHRHEPPVSANPIVVVHEDDDLVVIDKPAGIPVHPAGRYHFNTIIEIMRAERGLGFTPLPCNRLDRLTSGVMFIAKNPRAAERLTHQMMHRTISKEYVARVLGRFPDGLTECDKPILQVSPKLGLNRVRAIGKSARTVFQRMSYHPSSLVAVPELAIQDSSWPDPRAVDRQPTFTYRDSGGTDYSIVRCSPSTGRTHQLRVHLQYLGHPISNDPIYCNTRVWGASLGEADSGSDEDESIISRLSSMGKDQVADAVAYQDLERYQQQRAEKLSGKRCHICQTPLYNDPGQHELGIYLHAVRYSCEDGGWEYETKLPAWALKR